MYLSRLILNARSRAVRRDLADCQAMHRTVMSAFLSLQPSLEPALQSGEGARSQLGVLYRLDEDTRSGEITLLVQSGAAPDWTRLEPGYLRDTGGAPENPAWKRVDEQYGRVQGGMALAFRLKANPTRKIDTRSGPDGGRRNGKRVELRGEAAQVEWLERKGEQCGFRLLGVRAKAVMRDTVPEVRPAARERVTGVRAHGAKGEESVGRAFVTFASVLFEGELRVVDADRFRWALERGVGAGKAYGFGLLSIASIASLGREP